MQTFLPYDSFQDSAAVLDRSRLGKQRVETLQLVNLLTGAPSRWSNHPAARMWRGYVPALAQYGLVICSEWIGRGYKDTCYGKILDRVPEAEGSITLPPWFGFIDFHLAHRSNLLRKSWEHYYPFFGDIADDLEYIWPV